MIDFLLLFRVEITQLKSHIEVFLGFLSIFLFFTGRLAPIFPIFFWQYLRIKYVVSSFTQISFTSIDQKVLKRVLPKFLYESMVVFIKAKLNYMVDYSKEQQKKGGSSTVEE